MERCKVILNDRGARRQVIVTVLILLVLILIGQLVVAQMTRDYKKSMLEHDNEVAGYLSRNGLNNNLIIAAFTSDKTTTDKEIGFTLLSSSGYRENMLDSLLANIDSFHRKFSLIVLAFSAMFSFSLLGVLYYSLLRKDKQLKVADLQLRRFVDGDTTVRLEDGGEGSFSRLFADINTMATSLTAHIENEKQNRQFLKDTISDISHQLKTPLAALLMYNEIIMDEKTGNEVIESFTLKSRRELGRIENLIQNLLKIARFDAGTIELEKKIYRLENFFENVISSFLTRAELENKKIILHCNTATLCFDETWLGEAVGNIIKNALDHTSAGNLIEIFCMDTIVSTYIAISDNGSGIHSEDIHHIFKRFYRSRFTKDKQGAGIGLALSKIIVEKHGGTITVQSELGNGTEFHLVFPKLSNM